MATRNDRFVYFFVVVSLEMSPNFLFHGLINVELYTLSSLPSLSW